MVQEIRLLIQEMVDIFCLFVLFYKASWVAPAFKFALLDSRFLKKGEAIRFGESIAFDAHLIDIGEPNGSYKSPVDLIHLNIQGKDGNIIKKSELMDGRQDCHKDKKSVVKG